jgi:2-polyprenyl-3-methyl-5-hydroxy-6-metoxy-1,4-benzoquinol methylase
MSKLAEFVKAHDFPCWCGQTRRQPVCHQLFGRRHFAVLSCYDCGTNRILPRALQTQAAAEALYNEYQQPGVVAEQEADFVREMLGRFESVKLTFRPGLKVLDVGCGNGCLLDGICQRFECIGKGIDVDKRRIATALARKSRARFECGLFDPSKIDGHYDVVISSAVIEHVIDPVGFLQQLAAALPKGGSLFLLTPNAASLNYRLLRSWWRELLSIGEHIYLFTPESLAECAAKAGFEMVQANSDFDASHPQLQWNSPRSAALSAWALYCKGIKAVSRALSTPRTGDILFAHFKKRL